MASRSIVAPVREIMLLDGLTESDLEADLRAMHSALVKLESLAVDGSKFASRIFDCYYFFRTRCPVLLEHLVLQTYYSCLASKSWVRASYPTKPKR